MITAEAFIQISSMKRFLDEWGVNSNINSSLVKLMKAN